MKKRIFCTILLAFILISLVGCGTTGNPSAPDSPSATPIATPSATPSAADTPQPAPENVSFSLWHSYVGTDQRAGVMETSMGEFGKEHPEYVIDEQKIPRDQYQTKLKTQAAADALPEAFLCWPNAMTIEFAQAGLLADINGFLDANPDWKNSVVTPAISEFTVDGKTYSVGNGVSLTSLVFYNKDLFAKNSLTYPKTFSEFKQACQTFINNGVIPIAHGDKPQWPAQSSILSCVANRETGSEWLNNVLSGSGAKFTDPEFIKALNDIKDLATMGAFNKDYMSLDNAQMRDYFFRGEAAMMIDGSWALPEIIAKAPADLKANIQVGVLPAFEGGKGDANAVSGVSGTGIVISAKASSAQKSAIENLIMKLTGAGSQDMYVRNGIIPSALKTNVPDSEVDPVFKQVLTILGSSPLVAVYDSALNSEQAEIINNGLQSLMLGTQTPEAIAQELQNAVKP